MPKPRTHKPERPSATINLAGLRPGLSGQVTIRHADDEDHILGVIRRSGQFYEADLLECLARRLRHDDLVLDIGANIGNHALFFAAVCGCRVLAIEPDPLAFVLLTENIAGNGLEGRITALNIALGAEAGEGRMHHPDPHNLGASSVEPEAGGSIPIRTLDSLPRLRRLRLVKMDVENAEPLVLAGARKLLASRRRPVFTAEAPTREGFLRIEALLGAAGYVA
ncbi:MAG: FkbM family methyltransferase, partial [Roseococcus sp.]